LWKITNANQTKIFFANLMSKFLLVWGCWYYWYYWSVSNTWSRRNWFNWVYVWLYWNGDHSYIFWHGLETLLIQWQEFIQMLSSSENRSLTHLNELFQSVDHKDKNLSSMYPFVSKLYSIAVIQPLSTAEVERLFFQVALIKTSHRANIKTETLSKILNIKYNCDLYTDKNIHVWDKCVHAFFKHKNRRLVNTMWLLF
jgi:hypothetical protein